MGVKIAPATGMKDILPLAAQRKNRVINLLASTYHKWGFMPIETPALEPVERLLNSDGGDNEKLMFQVLRRGLQAGDYENALANPKSIVDLGLRYDLTVPLSRFYASNHSRLPKVCKFLQYGAVWRAERPQKGRFRQFMQWDADIIGAAEGLPEIQLLICSAQALHSLGLNNFIIRFNDRRVLKALVSSVGIEEARQEDAFIIIDKLDKVGLEGVEKEMTEKAFAPAHIAQLLAKIEPFIASPAASIEEGLNLLDIQIDEPILETMQLVFNTVRSKAEAFTIVFDPTLVRGMGYYTGQIFETQYADYGFSIAGGGRYNGMIGRFLGRDVPACGLSLGFDRIMAILEDKAFKGESEKPQKTLLLVQENEIAEAISYAEDLRKKLGDVSIEIKAKNTKRQLEDSKALGFTHWGIFNSQQASNIQEIN